MTTSRAYAVVIEPTVTGYSAYVPDLPGCISTASSLEEMERNIREAIELHLDGLTEDGDPIPEPTATVRIIDVASAA
jgi:predicted RNase H-like HicB family nuclease